MKHGLIMLLTLVALSVGTARAASYDFGGCTVTPSGATVTTDNGELVITFTQSGSLSVSCDVRADILVVGGGGGGGGAYYSSNTYRYNGNGGNGGAVQYVLGETLASGQAMTVTVGAAGTGGEGVAKKTTAKSGVAGGDSSMKISSSKTILAEGGKGGAGGSKNTNGTAGAAGAGAKSYDISGTSVAYGSAGAKAGSSKATDVSSANGQGGQGGYKSSSNTSSNRSGGKGGGGVVIVRLKEVLVQREPIAKPTAATGLTYDGSVQTGVVAGEHYTLGGVTAATAAGTYTATVTPANGYCWLDGTYGTLSLDWSIAKRPVTVSVVATNKVVGAEEPVYPTRAEGFVGGDDAEVSWKVWRTNLVEQTDGSFGLDESVGNYDLVVAGSTDETANYTISYVNGVGAFEIRPAVIEIAVPTAATGFVYDGTVKTGIANGTGYALSGTVTATDDGEYVATATLLEGYCWAGGSTAAKTISWSIARAGYDLSGVVFQDKVSGYNGQVQPMSVTGSLPSGVAVAYENNANKDVGVYTVTAKFTGDTKNHNTIADRKAKLTIEPAAASVTADAKAKTFGAADPELTATVFGLFGADTIAYALVRAEGEYVGTYAITPTGAAEQGNYTVTFVPGTLTVGKATPVPEDSLTLALTYGETLGEKAPSVVGAMTANGKDVTGTFAFAAAGTMPVVGDGAAQPFAATFTPDDEDNYNAADVVVMATVRPLAIAVTPDAGQEKKVGEEYAIAFTTNVAMVGTDRFMGALTATDEVGEQLITRGTLAIDDGHGGGNYALTVDETVTIKVKARDPSVSDGKGTVDYDSDSHKVVVTPDAGVTDVEIVNMPEDATAQVPVSVDTIKGVSSNQVVVIAEATNETGTVKVDITEAFKITETSTGVTISLNDDPAAEVMVEIGGKTEAIKVTPELTATGDAVVEPLAVADDDVSLGAKTIPGLTYTLKRMTTLGGDATEVASETAKGTRMKLTDPMADGKPAQAFYVIEVTK